MFLLLLQMTVCLGRLLGMLFLSSPKDISGMVSDISVVFHQPLRTVVEKVKFPRMRTKQETFQFSDRSLEEDLFCLDILGSPFVLKTDHDMPD